MMTKNDALTFAIDALLKNPCEEVSNVVTVLAKMREQLSRKPLTDEQKEARNAANRAKTAEKRAALMATVIPVLTKAFRRFEMPVTAKELYENVKDELPADFTAGKVQDILLREMAPILHKIETKRYANMYELREEPGEIDF